MPGLDQGDWILVTGATGFVGAALVHELLSRGHRVLCLVRAPSPAIARSRIVQALRTWTKAGERLLETGQLAVLRGDLHQPDCGLTGALRHSLRGKVRALIHAAGDTRFFTTTAGEPNRTNVGGTRHVLECARRIDCPDWHYVSTAYVAGIAREAPETRGATAPCFRNAYEQSKWEAEHLADGQARQAGATLTIYRPSIVVGHSASGLTTHFAGIYYLFRATSLLARSVSQRSDVDRHAIPLRIPAMPDRRPNLICIDDVASAFASLFESPAARGGIYHLTHPAPPTNDQIKRVLESYYDIGGGRFADASEDPVCARPKASPATDTFQRMFDELTAPLRDYLFDAPVFSRASTERFVSRPPAEWTDARLRVLVAAAELGGWRTSGFERQVAAAPAELEAYFREFLPVRLAQSRIGRVEKLELAVRFEIGGQTHGHWWCRFRGGRLEEVAPARDQAADVTYRTSESRFWAAVAGEITAAELFLAGEAQVFGNIERALKFAMVLEDFVREHPYYRETTGPPVGLTTQPPQVRHGS